MQKAKQERTVARRLFTVSSSKLEEHLEKCNKTSIAAEFNKLSERYKTLENIQNNILSLWLEDSERNEDEFNEDLLAAEEYIDKWFLLKQKVHEFMENLNTISKPAQGKSEYESVTSNKGHVQYLRYPKLELPKYDGTVGKWLLFWAQFKKIHRDEQLDDDEKFHYLLQCMEHGSSARELVESFPPTGDNYQVVINQLKDRFARDELIIEHYVRELLQLVLAQTKGTLRQSMRSLYDKLMTQILALDSLGVTQDKYAAFLYPLVESALPEDVLRAWSRSHLHVTTQKEKGTPLSDLLNFVKQEVEAEERIRLARSGYNDGCSPSTPTAAFFTSSPGTSKRNDKKHSKEVQQSAEAKVKECIWCEKTSHSSSECKQAMNKTLDERREFIKTKNACSICLNKGHFWKKCRKQSISEQCQTVLLQTLKVKLTNGDNKIIVRALLDSGAQRSFVKSDVVEKLQMKPIETREMSHSLFGGNVTKKSKQNVYEINIQSLNGQYKRKMKVIEQGVICGYLPKLRKGSILTRLQNLNICLTDCIDDVSETSLLISVWNSGMSAGRTIQLEDDLLAIETKLGWTLQGPASGVYCSLGNVDTHAIGNVNTYSFDVADFWKLETLGIRDESEVICERQINSEVLETFKKTIRINEEERYEVNLPWKYTAGLLQTNYNLALKRLKSTTAKLVKLGILGDYDKVFEEWRDCDIIEEVHNDNPLTGHYMPHHAVVKESSLTTKIRPVFDASAKDSNGFSLNSCLEKGINLIEMIPRLIIQFRRNAIGVTADIKKAFLQISLNPSDRDYLKFLWWRDVNHDTKALKVFRHRRVVFGVTTSPFLLSATILHHLEQFNDKTASILRTSFYVDNCVLSVKNEQEMQVFINEAKELMSKGKFELRCWVTGPTITDNETSTISVLGLMWDPQRDEIFCKIPSVNIQLDKELTKRSALSAVQSVFDPIGLACATTIIPKLIIQKCWILNIDWDEELPENLKTIFNTWLHQINCLDHCRVARPLSDFDLDSSRNSLHIFCDASQVAYAACIFLRSEHENNVRVQLVLAKSRVAPTKAVTIPRLELIAALMAVRLCTDAKKGLDFKYDEYYWTDSSIVLAWIKRKIGLNTFVHNRVKEIVNTSDVSRWHHIPGELNPADLPSRGCNPEVLKESRWWEGPDWLKMTPEQWPMSEPTPNEVEVQKEIKKCCLFTQEEGKFSERFCYFSKYPKIVRMVAWILRFSFNCRQKGKQKKSGNISAEEYLDGEFCILRLLQSEFFGETENLNSKFNLEIFRDNLNLFRIKSRLSLTEDSYEFKYPILVSSRNVIIERLVMHKHVQNLHAGSQTLINILREDYWIIGIRRLARKIVQRCVICKRYSAKACSGPSAPLPNDRVNCGSVFEVTGTDLAGPLQLKSGVKCWIIIFTCATYRAVHLEICTSLSTADFLLALRRFIARRNNVNIIYSDNGTNFRGASNLLKNIDWEEVSTEMSLKKISWRHIPPAAPWWGGFWERLIKVVKGILIRVLGKAALQYEELGTVLCEVESIINSRPLTYIAKSSENVVPLAPSMFLNVSSTSYFNADLFSCLNGPILTARWRYLTKLYEDLKQRFRSEYLALLVHKSSGSNSKSRYDLKLGDVVLIGSDDRKRIYWPLGVIIEIITGKDNRNRVARIKTEGGVLTRPFQRIFPLEITQEQYVSDDST